MTPVVTPSQGTAYVITFSRVLLFVACILFVIASLAAGGVLSGVSPWAFGFGGFAAWMLAGAVP